MCEEKHESFGKTVDRVRESLATMREGADGDDNANAVEAWDAATGGGPNDDHEAWAAATGDDDELEASLAEDAP